MPFDELGIVYPTVDDALRAYATIFGCTIDQARDQVMRLPGLESALARPRNYAEILHADVALQAAALAHAIFSNHPFVEGNKRTAELVMLFFLRLNGYACPAPQKEKFGWILDFASGQGPEEPAQKIRPYLIEV